MKGTHDMDMLVYEAPKSTGFGHRVLNKNHYQAALVVSNFLRTYGDIDRNLPTHFTLNHDSSMNHDVRQKFISAFSDAFGMPQPLHTSDTNIINPAVIWDVSNQDLVELVRFLYEECESDNKITAAQFFLSRAYTFHWKNMNIHRNTLGICLTNKMFVQPTFYFPNSIEKESTLDFIKEVFDAMPFKVNIKYFKAVQIESNASRIRTRKLTEHDQALLNLSLTR